jgi:hypothetical protein
VEILSFCNIIWLEFKSLFKVKLSYMIIFIIILSLFNRFFIGLMGLHTLENTILIIIFGFAILGNIISTTEIRDGCYDLLKSIGNRSLFYTSKLLSGYIYTTLINFILILFILYIGFINHDSKFLTIESIRFALLYFYLTAIISLTIGFIIGLLVHNKLSYFIVVVISGFIGIIAKRLYMANLNKFIKQFHLGIFDPMQMPSQFYGFDTEIYRFLHHFVILAILLLLFLIILFYKDRKNKKIISIFLIIFTFTNIFLLNLYSKPYFVRYTEGPESIFQEEESFYEDKDLKYKNSPFSINSMDLNVDLRRCLKVNGNINIKLLKETNVIDFTLYRKLKIKNITLNNKPLNFYQKDDNFKVYFKEKYPQNKNLKLNINYKGLTSQRYFAGEKAIYLTANYGWLPYSGKTNAFYEEEKSHINTTPLENINKVDYHIKLKHYNNKIISNLKVSNDTLSGKSNGVSLVSGNLITFTQNNKHYCYNFTFEDLSNKDQYVNFLDKYTTISNNIEEILGMKKTILNKLVVLPYINYDSRSIYQMYATKSDDLLLWGTEVVLNNDNVIVDSALSSIVSSNINYVRQDALVKRYFYELLQNWIYKKNNYSLEEQFDSKNLLKIKDTLFLDLLNKLIAKNNNDVNIFFSNWYKQMCSNKKITLYDIRNFIE